MPLDAHRRTNLRNWEDRVPVHAASQSYDLAGLATDPNRLTGVVARDRERLGRLDGLDVLHLQCHIGTDTLSLKRLGARSVSDFRTWGYSGTLGCNRIGFNVYDIGGGTGARARCRYGILLNNESTCEGSVDGGRGLGCRGYYGTQISAGQGDGIVATSHERGWIFVR